MWKNQAGNKAGRRERGEPGNDPFQAAIRQPGGCGKWPAFNSAVIASPLHQRLLRDHAASAHVRLHQWLPNRDFLILAPNWCGKRSGKYQISQQKEADSEPCESILPLLAIMVLSLHKQCVFLFSLCSFGVFFVTMVPIMPQSQNDALNSTWKLLFSKIQQRSDAVCCQNTLPLHPPYLILNFLSFQHCCCCFLQRG